MIEQVNPAVGAAVSTIGENNSFLIPNIGFILLAVSVFFIYKKFKGVFKND